MIRDADLEKHLYEEQSLNIEPLCILEINQNNYWDIEQLGVFKTGTYSDAMFKNWPPTAPRGLTPEDMYYSYDYVTSEIHASEKIFETIYFTKRRKRDYFSLADCFTDFRPRSGINKLVNPGSIQGISFVDNFTSARRPRFYVPSVGDIFKYWTSWINEITTENQFNVETVTGYTGLSGTGGVIKEAAPFVIYFKALPMNMVSVKVQTGIGQTSPGLTAYRQSTSYTDPLMRVDLSTLPDVWRIEYLNTFDTWVTIKSFKDYRDARLQENNGALDLVYMVTNPNLSLYPNFVLRGYIETENHLPIMARHGDAFVVGRSKTNRGELHVFNNNSDTWTNHGTVAYGWEFYEQEMLESAAIKNLIDPEYYNPSAGTNGDDPHNDEYNDFVVIKGLRIVVEKMKAVNKPFELIELSPRLLCNITEYMRDYSVEKVMGQDTDLLAGDFAVHNGTVTLSNAQLLLNRETEFKPLDDFETFPSTGERLKDDNGNDIPRDRHSGSLLSKRVRRNTRFKIYEIIRNVKSQKNSLIYDKIVPIKTLYSLDHPVVFDGNSDIEIELRDASMLFENSPCPNLLLYNCSLSKAVAVLLDWVGFSNYIFKDNENPHRDNEVFLTNPYVDKIIIPYFFTNKDQTVLEALSELSRATQCPMYFDENNNFVVVPPNYFAGPEPVYTFYGTKYGDIRANIESIDDISETEVSDINIKFTSRGPEQNATYSMMKETVGIYSGFSQGRDSATNNMNLNLRNINTIKWGYVPRSVWNGAESDDLKNNILTAAVLNSNLSDRVPQFVNDGRNIANNTIDVGIYAEYFKDYQGFLLMNGEIIEYDAIEYNIANKRFWIQSREQLEEQVNLATNTKHAIPYAYATGNLRIYTEITPYNSEDRSARTMEVLRHGRGRFGTPITSHSANIDAPWAGNRVTTFSDTGTHTLFGNVAIKGNWNFAPRASTVKNANIAVTEYIINGLYTNSSLQNKFPRAFSSIAAGDIPKLVSQGKIMKASALTMSGPTTATANNIFVKTKQLNAKVFHPSPGNTTTIFGTRLGIIGDPKLNVIDSPNMIGTAVDADKAKKNVYYASGGLSLLTSNQYPSLSGRSNDGYYFELGVLDKDHRKENGELVANLRFFKVNNGTALSAGLPNDNVSIPLWSGYVDVTLTRGAGTDRTRYVASNKQVHDLAVEWNETTSANLITNTFILYYNNNKIATVTDSNRTTGYLPRQYGQLEFGLFVRGKSSVQFEHVYAVKTGKKHPPRAIIEDSFNYDWDKPTDFMMFSPSALWTQAMIDVAAKNSGIYYDEFGTIARQVKHVNANFTSVPVMSAQVQIQPVFDRVHFVSAFTYDPYQASFLLWNMADATIEVHGDAKETALQILGIPFRGSPEETLSLRSFLIDRNAGDKTNDSAALNLQSQYYNLIGSDKIRATVQAELTSQYIQNREQVKYLFSWLNHFTGSPFIRMSITAFGTPHIQLGDLVDIRYNMPGRVKTSAKKKEEPLTPADSKYEIDYVTLQEEIQGWFVVKKINIERGEEGPIYKYDLIEIPILEDLHGKSIYPGGY